MSVWHWLIIILVFVLPAAAAIYTGRRARTPTGEPEGFGGWLLYLAIGQAVSPLVALATGFKSLSDGLEVWSAPGAPVAVVVETAMNIGLFIIVAATTLAMWRRDARFPTLFGYQWLAYVAVTLIDAVMVSYIFNVSVKQVVDGSVREFVQGIVGGGIWYWYVVKSVRVKNTFTRRPQEPAAAEPPAAPA